MFRMAGWLCAACAAQCRGSPDKLDRKAVSDQLSKTRLSSPHRKSSVQTCQRISPVYVGSSIGLFVSVV